MSSNFLTYFVLIKNIIYKYTIMCKILKKLWLLKYYYINYSNKKYFFILTFYVVFIHVSWFLELFNTDECILLLF